jgi:peptidoglycan-associated lipoprotein
MKLNRLAQIILVGSCVLALSSCARHKYNTGTYVADNSPADMHMAQATGIGENERFGDGNKLSMHIPGKKAGRTYYFAFDQSEVRDSDKAAIFANADYLLTHPHAKIILEGHTDPRGSREYNVALGERRANAVVELLKSKGVNPNQIRVVSYGAQRLAMSGHDEQAYQLDRRAMIVNQR